MTSLLPRKTCNVCGIEKSELDDFPENYHRPGYFQSTCKACKNAKAAEKRRAKAEADKAEAIVEPDVVVSLDDVRDPKYDWYWKQMDVRAEARRRRRARIYEAEHESYTEADVLSRWGSKCWICDVEVDLSAPRVIGKPGWERGLHLEHVVDLAFGGADVVENVRPSHGICNLRKPRKR